MRRTSVLLVTVIAIVSSLFAFAPRAEAHPCDFYEDPLGCLLPPDIPRLPNLPKPPNPPCNSVDTCVGGVSPTVSTQVLETMVVLANDADGIVTQQPLLGGRTYTFVASGELLDRATGAVADPECSATTSDTTWQPHRLGVTPDLLDLTLNGTSVTWLPADTSAPCDEATHVYTFTAAISTTTFIRAAVADASHADNVGALQLSIAVTGVGAVPHVPNPGPLVPGNQLVDVVLVDSRNPLGALTTIPLTAGRQYTWVVSGTYVYELGGARADGECSQPLGEPAGQFDRETYGPGLLDMTINGFDPPWEALTVDIGGCDPTHQYSWGATLTTTGRVHFRIKEGSVAGYRDNAGLLTVAVYGS